MNKDELQKFKLACVRSTELAPIFDRMLGRALTARKALAKYGQESASGQEQKEDKDLFESSAREYERAKSELAVTCQKYQLTMPEFSMNDLCNSVS